jgi:rSAM/selenodomain-associated transferase 2
LSAPISVVIPTLDAAATLPGTLASLMEGVELGLIRELVISDGGSTDGTLRIAEEAGAILIDGPASRGGQLQRGCASARGDWLFILHADTQLAPGWTEGVTQHLATGDAGWGRLRFDSGGRVVAGWANLRSRLFGLPYGDQGLLLSRTLYDAAGGYPGYPLMEDVALARALSGHLRPMDVIAVTSAEKYRRQGWLRRGARNLWCLLRWFAGVSPDRLAEGYRR